MAILGLLIPSEGECGGLAGASAHGHLAQLGRSEGDTPRRRTRRHGGAACSRAGTSRPPQGTGARTRCARARRARCAWKEGDRKVESAVRAGTSSGELGHGGAEMKNRPQPPLTSTTVAERRRKRRSLTRRSCGLEVGGGGAVELARGGGGGGALLSGAVPCRSERRGEHERAGERAGVSGEERSVVGRKRRARGAESGRLRRAAGVAGTWPPRGGRVLPRSERRVGTGAAQRWAGQTHVGLGWRGRGGSLVRLRPWAEKRGGGP